MSDLRQEAQQALRDAMRRYGMSADDLHQHITDGRPCWCGPEWRCAHCDVVGPCIHGSARVEIAVHRRAS